MIKPTVGRVVWVWPGRAVRSHVCLDQTQPFCASVVYVTDDRTINVAGFDHRGDHFSAQSIPLLQDDDEADPTATYAQWMPYQKGQAAKTEQLEAKLTGS